MNHPRTALLIIALTILVSARAQAQDGTEEFLFGVNMRLQPTSRTFVASATPTIYGENASITSREGIDGSAVLELSGGYKFRPRLWGVLAVSTTLGGNSEAHVVAQIPHPLLYDRPLTSVADVTNLRRTERFAHLSAMWTTPITSRIDGAVLAGPSYVKVFQGIVQRFDVTPGTQTGTAVKEEITATRLGFHLGADATYRVTSMVSAGLTVRFVRAAAKVPTVADLKTGGFQFGVGLRMFY
jgi:hypothetical protein